MATSTAFPVIKGALNLHQRQYEGNKEHWKPVLDKYFSALAETSSEGRAEALSRHVERGQLLGIKSYAMGC